MNKLQVNMQIAIQALKDIDQPLVALERDKPEGTVLNGMAWSICNDPEHLKEIARTALRKIGRSSPESPWQ